MNLKTFVEETLCQLAEGVEAAQKRLAPLGVTVNPYFKIDALGYFEKLKAAGVPEEQAKVQAAAFREFTAIQDENARRELATKLDLAQMEMRLRADLTKEIQTAKQETLRWLVGLMVGLAAFLTAVLTYVK